jgi:5'-3' exonuclease
MGIKGGQHFFRSNNGKLDGIETVSLSYFYGKTIVIDLMFYLHRYVYRGVYDDDYLHEFVNLSHKMDYFGINYIYLFDGKPLEDKHDTIETRKQVKQEFEKQIEKIKNYDSHTEEDIKQIINLTRKTRNITPIHIKRVKCLFDKLGIQYIHNKAVEADPIVKFLVDCEFADACLTGDMDLLAYGCNNIMFDLDYSNNTVILINLERLLNSLQIDYKQFVQICVLSGTDYNSPLEHSNFSNNIKLIKQYGNIQTLLDNIPKINHNKSFYHRLIIPDKFDWQKTINIYRSSINEMELQKILDDIDNFHERMKTLINDQFIETLTKRMQKMAKQPNGEKYVRKVLQIMKLRHNLTIKYDFTSSSELMSTSPPSHTTSTIPTTTQLNKYTTDIASIGLDFNTSSSDTVYHQVPLSSIYSVQQKPIRQLVKFDWS